MGDGKELGYFCDQGGLKYGSGSQNEMRGDFLTLLDPILDASQIHSGTDGLLNGELLLSFSAVMQASHGLRFVITGNPYAFDYIYHCEFKSRHR